MKEKDIILKWRRKGREHSKEVNRQEFLNLMNNVKLFYSEDSQFSVFFCRIIPNIDYIWVDMDRNDEFKIPFIEYELDERRYIVEIPRKHKMIWLIIEEYTK